MIAQPDLDVEDYADYNFGITSATKACHVKYTYRADRRIISHGFVVKDDRARTVTGFYRNGTRSEMRDAHAYVFRALRNIQDGSLRPEWKEREIEFTDSDGVTTTKPTLVHQVREITAGSLCRDRDCGSFGEFEPHDEGGPLHTRSCGDDVDVCWTDDGPATCYVLGSDEDVSGERIDGLIAQLERAKADLLLRSSRRAAECPCWDTSAGACDSCRLQAAH